MKLEVGKKLTRLLGGEIPMIVVIESIDIKTNTFMVNVEDSNIPVGEGWTFCSKTGYEIDDFLKWGPRYKRSGSFIKEIKVDNLLEKS